MQKHCWRKWEKGSGKTPIVAWNPRECRGVSQCRERVEVGKAYSLPAGRYGQTIRGAIISYHQSSSFSAYFKISSKSKCQTECKLYKIQRGLTMTENIIVILFVYRCLIKEEPSIYFLRIFCYYYYRCFLWAKLLSHPFWASLLETTRLLDRPKIYYAGMDNRSVCFCAL